MGRHATDDELPQAVGHRRLAVALGARLRWALFVANATTAAALFADRPGQSPTLAFLAGIADLQLWAVLFAAAAVLLVVGAAELAHVLAVIGWVMLAGGAIGAVVTDNSRSPSGSIIFAGLLVTVAAFHVLGLVYRVAHRRAGP